MVVAKGVSFGPYEIVSHLGSGGMGEVWRARDRRIRRDVAIKVLPEAFPPGDKRVERFELEARAAGALNHPNLVTIFDIGNHDGSPYIVMELLDGQTLRETIEDAGPGPLPVRKVVDYAIQEISPALEHALRHCLEKDPRERFQSARDLAFHLQTVPEMQRSVTGSRKVVTPRSRLAMRAGMVALPVLLGVAAGGWAVRRFHDGASPSVPRAYTQLTSADGLEIFPTPAPDGKSFAYVSAQSGNRDIYVQRVDGRTSVNITADWPDDDTEPAFSPDGSQIAFRSERDGGGIFVMAPTGESPRRLTDFGHNPAWSPDGAKIAFSTEEIELLPNFRPHLAELWMVDVHTGERRPLIQPRKGGPDFGGDSDAVQPNWSPHGKRIAFWSTTIAGKRDIWTIDPGAPEPKRTAVRVTSDAALNWNPVWSPDGKYLYYGSDRDGTLNLWRVEMDEDAGAPVAPPEAVGLPATIAGNFAFARSEELAYVTVTSSHRVLAMPFDVNAGTLGPPRQIFGGSQEILAFQPSPDGTRLAYATSGVREDVYVADAARIRQLTNDTAKDRGVQWTPDGKTIYFYSNRDGTYRVWSIRADGSYPRPVTDDSDAKSMGMSGLTTPVPSPDGRTLLVQSARQTSALIHLDRPAGRRVELLPVYLPMAKWSPDGQFIVARSDDEAERRGTSKVALGGIALYSLRTRRLERLSEGGNSPHWTPDGRKIIYFEPHEIRILDLDSRTTRTVTPTLPPGIDFRGMVRVSPDTATLYVRQAVQQSDIWLVRFPDDSGATADGGR